MRNKFQEIISLPIISFLIILSSCSKKMEAYSFESSSESSINSAENIKKIIEVFNSDNLIKELFNSAERTINECKNLNSIKSFSSDIKALATIKDTVELLKYIQTSDKKYLTDLNSIIKSDLFLQNEFHKKYYFVSKLTIENKRIIINKIYENYIANKSITNNEIVKKSFMLIESDKCQDDFLKQNDRCDRNGTFGYFMCFLSGPATPACVLTVIVTTAWCFEDSKVDYQECQKKKNI